MIWFNIVFLPKTRHYSAIMNLGKSWSFKDLSFKGWKIYWFSFFFLAKNRLQRIFLLKGLRNFWQYLFYRIPSEAVQRDSAYSLVVFTAHRNIVPFQKRGHTYFSTDYFLGLTYKLGTTVSSIFQPLISHHRSNIRNE